MAHVIADEYPGWKVKLAVYGLAPLQDLNASQDGNIFPAMCWLGAPSEFQITDSATERIAPKYPHPRAREWGATTTRVFERAGR